MAPPVLGSEVEVRRTGKVTKYNNDNSINVKLNSGRGRPHKISFGDVLPGAAEEKNAVSVATSQVADCPNRMDVVDVSAGLRLGKILSWGSVVTLGGAIIVGMFHGVGAKLMDALWTYLKSHGLM